MKLIIHCGFHKTGTTSFQKICYTNIELFKSHNIFYPEHESKQHWHFFVNINSEFIENQHRLAKKNIDPNGIWLLSAEDFEGFLVRLDLAKQIEVYCEKNNIELEWIFVNRNQFDYLNSLYSQISRKYDKKGFVINYDMMADAILKNGIFTLSTKRLDYYFIFNYKDYIENFSRNINGKVRVIDYDYFNETYSGRPIIKSISNEIDNIFSTKNEIKNIHLNTRLSDYDVEKRYLSNYLGLTSDSLDLRKESYSSLINHRVEVTRRMKEFYEYTIKESFLNQNFYEKDVIL